MLDDISAVLSMAQKQKNDNPAVLNSNVYRNEETIKPNVKVSELRENDKLYEKSVFLDEKDQKLSKEYFEKEQQKHKDKSNKKSGKDVILQSSNNKTTTFVEAKPAVSPVKSTAVPANKTNVLQKKEAAKPDNSTKQNEEKTLDEIWNALEANANSNGKSFSQTGNNST